MELSINISARMLEKDEIRTLEIDVDGATITGTKAAPSFPIASTVAEAGGGRTAHRKAADDKVEEKPEYEPLPGAGSEPLAGREIPEDPVTMTEDLPPLGNSPDEPLGEPLDGQEHDDLRIPDLAQEEKFLMEDNLDTEVSGPSSTKKTMEYDPTVGLLDLDFKGPEPGEESKKGLFGRFGKKKSS
jgi:hypothetical protein